VIDSRIMVQLRTTGSIPGIPGVPDNGCVISHPRHAPSATIEEKSEADHNPTHQHDKRPNCEKASSPAAGKVLVDGDLEEQGMPVGKGMDPADDGDAQWLKPGHCGIRSEGEPCMTLLIS